ncbi:peptide/nickel transport system ATP-binding protein [Amphibacillus marinus]|uniref:Peptide/nickel transport system ATP-binding protein n=1 Tax=Amphibacillus marinus TaxID=872970 RepID=A0A1H8M390_9BACI|nr:ABC transporter ATP-binding protein [Amphibacillus marinus]SEO11628.1 peptide/nickel transport system ATP-binding protein [Amphibacillus marinus]
MTLLKVEQLHTHIHTNKGRVSPVRGVSFSIEKGEVTGVVGESGSGKSVMSQSLIRLLDREGNIEYNGQIHFDNKDVLALSEAELRKLRGNDISIIFQDALSSLNPLYTVGNQIVEAIRTHQSLSKKTARKQAIEFLRLTGIPSPETRFNSYPHELSGGMQQRVMIAMALVSKPKLLIADEPTTALDVTIQAQILDLIIQLNTEFEMSILFITHDLGVVREICSSVKVMYLGQIVEEGPTETIFNQPLHPYTKLLLASMPKLNSDRTEPLPAITGTVPSLSNIPKGCSFSTRCPYATDLCREQEPPMFSNDGQRVQCWLYDEEKGGWLD